MLFICYPTPNRTQPSKIGLANTWADGVMESIKNPMPQSFNTAEEVLQIGVLQLCPIFEIACRNSDTL
jgi:hypothetical protein